MKKPDLVRRYGVHSKFIVRRPSDPNSKKLELNFIKHIRSPEAELLNTEAVLKGNNQTERILYQPITTVHLQPSSCGLLQFRCQFFTDFTLTCI